MRRESYKMSFPSIRSGCAIKIWPWKENYPVLDLRSMLN